MLSFPELTPTGTPCSTRWSWAELRRSRFPIGCLSASRFILPTEPAFWPPLWIRRPGPSKARLFPLRAAPRAIPAIFHPLWIPWESSAGWRSEEHTSELQSHSDLVCRLLLEKKKKYKICMIERELLIEY